MQTKLSSKWLKPLTDAKNDARQQVEQTREADQPKCACLEYVGDSPACPTPEHRKMYEQYLQK